VPSLVTEKEYSLGSYAAVAPLRMVNLRLTDNLMGSVTAFCNRYDITLKAAIELFILMGLADDKAPSLALAYEKRLRKRQRDSANMRLRLHRNKHLL